MKTDSIRDHYNIFPSPVGFKPGRRLILKAIGIAGFIASLPSFLWAYFVERLGVRTVEKDNFVFESASGTVFWKIEKRREPYRFIIGGLVEKVAMLTYQELLALPQVPETSDFHCVEGWSVKDILWGGIRFEEIMKIARPFPEAKYALFHALGETEDAPRGQREYIECLPIQHLLDPRKECLLALSMNGIPLPHDHGAPLRVIAPYDLGYKSIKYVYRVDFVKEEKPGWWTLANPVYPVNAPVPASRLRK
jgi:DMSO/TMAO reductase YedYZ molybdopterin-dependent catalytic subunit